MHLCQQQNHLTLRVSRKKLLNSQYETPSTKQIIIYQSIRIPLNKIHFFNPNHSIRTLMRLYIFSQECVHYIFNNLNLTANRVTHLSYQRTEYVINNNPRFILSKIKSENSNSKSNLTTILTLHLIIRALRQ